MKRAVLASFLGVLLLSGTAMAKPKAGAAGAAGGGGGGGAGAGYTKVKTYDFSGDTIDGELVKPDGEMVDTRKFAEHTSLIRVRLDFIKEIVKSAEDL